jgi:uncharacterized RDD family membrane protein YckC
VGGIVGRFVALLIDGILLSVLSGAILFGVVGSEVVSVAASMGATAQEAASAEDAASAEEGKEAVAEAATEGAAAIGGKIGLALALVLALQVLYPIVFEGAMSATVGKMAMGLRVTKKDKTPCGFVKAIIRNVVKCVLNIISMIVALFTSDRQAVHDLAAGTLVIKKGAPEPEDTPEDEEFEDEDEEEEGAEDEAAEEDEVDDIDDLDDEED